MLRCPGLDGSAAVLALRLGWVKDVSEARSVGKIISVFTLGVQLEEQDRCWGSMSCCVPNQCPCETCPQPGGK